MARDSRPDFVFGLCILAALIACGWYAAHGGKLFRGDGTPGGDRAADHLNSASQAIGRGAFRVDR